MLAFDRERVRVLSAAVRGALGHLTVVRCDDPLAREVDDLLHRCDDILRPWVDRLRDVAADRVLEGYTPVFGSSADLAALEALALVQGAGWTVWATADDRPSLSDGELLELLRRMTPEELVDLVDDLSHEWATASSGVTTAWTTDEIDAVLALVGRSVSSRGPSTGATASTVLGQVSPDAAARVLRGMVVDAATLSAYAVEVLGRWLDQPSVDRWWPHTAPGDVLFPSLAAAGAPARTFLAAVADDSHGLYLVSSTCTDATLATALIVGATDPADCTTTSAGAIVRPWLDHVLAAETWPDLPYDTRLTDGLGTVVAPWLLQMTSRADDWGWQQQAAVERLTLVVRDTDALQRLIEERARVLASLGAVVDLEDPRSTSAALRDISGMVGWLDAIVTAEEVDDELADRFLWDIGWELAGQVANAAVRSTGVGGAGGRASSAAVRTSLGRLQAAMEENGWMGAPRAAAVIVADGAHRRERRNVALAHAAAWAVVEAFREIGTADVPDPPPLPDIGECVAADWLDDAAAWLDELEEPVRSAADLAIATMLNDYQAAVACHDGP